MFNIVQTIEKGQKHLTIVPPRWENDGFLSWPRIGADKLVLDVNSVPNEDNYWFRMPCKLKRNHLISYEIAEEELERMLENEDTEQDEYETHTIQRKKRAQVKSKAVSNNSAVDFNSLLDA